MQLLFEGVLSFSLCSMCGHTSRNSGSDYSLAIILHSISTYGASVQLPVCMSTMHQNVKLMMQISDLPINISPLFSMNEANL